MVFKGLKPMPALKPLSLSTGTLPNGIPSTIYNGEFPYTGAAEVNVLTPLIATVMFAPELTGVLRNEQARRFPFQSHIGFGNRLLFYFRRCYLLTEPVLRRLVWCHNQ